MMINVPVSTRGLTLLWAFVVMLGAGAAAQTPAPPAPVPAPAPAAPGTGQLTPSTSMPPGDFLDHVGQKVKARWRQLYRESPPAASSERLRVAFTLGGLMAESHLAVQAGDAQQFRNNNQEVIKLCGVLGLADKISPDVMAGSKMAESEDWPALRKQVLQTQQHIEAVLNEQRDEDPALLMGLGLWVRLFDISTTLVLAEPNLPDKTICIGSIAMLDELVASFERLTEPSRSNEAVSLIGAALEMLQRHWTAAEGAATQDVVQMTHQKLNYVIGKLEAK